MNNPQPYDKFRIRSFIRREGKITYAQKKALQELWPIYGLELDVIAAQAPTKPWVMDIGFGNGESLIDAALRCPDMEFLGVEVHRPGVGHALTNVQENDIQNVRFSKDDVIDVLAAVPDHALSGVCIFFPDPWHKTRHNKRRLIQKEFLNTLEQKLKPDGFLHIATDWDHYAEHIAEVLSEHERFKHFTTLINRQGLDELDECFKRPITKYERRAARLEHTVHDFICA